MSAEKKRQRMAGLTLQVAARLMETPGSGSVLYRVATRQLGLTSIHQVDIPEHTPPYRPIHLAGAPRPIVVERQPADGGE
jgi:hypothetical protein